MALIADIELDSGLVIKDAYLRISTFSGDDRVLSFILNAYVSREAYKEGKSPVNSYNYAYDFDKTRNVFGQSYEYLRGLPQFADATDA